VLTFDRHPATVVRPSSAPRLLTGLAHKLELLEELGVDEVVVLRFDALRAGELAEDFVRDVLVGDLAAQVVVVGESFRFGHRQGGDVELLRALGAELDFVVDSVALVADDVGEGDDIVSSSRIRGLVSRGRVGEAARLLGRPHEVRGTCVAANEVEVDAGLLLPTGGGYRGEVALVGDGKARLWSPATLDVAVDVAGDLDLVTHAGASAGASAGGSASAGVNRVHVALDQSAPVAMLEQGTDVALRFTGSTDR